MSRSVVVLAGLGGSPGQVWELVDHSRDDEQCRGSLSSPGDMMRWRCLSLGCAGQGGPCVTGLGPSSGGTPLLWWNQGDTAHAWQRCLAARASHGLECCLVDLRAALRFCVL